MPASKNSGKRVRLIQSALALVYKHGFAETRLIDIAEEANVPPGNVYYYFKTKEEIGAAIIDERLSQIKVLQEKLGKMESAQDRLCAFVKMTFDNRGMLAGRGCPIGSLCTELHKEEGPLAARSTVLFEQLLEWLEVQFQALGKADDSRGLAVHLLSALQGIAVLAHSLNDPDIVALEAERLHKWIRALDIKPAEE